MKLDETSAKPTSHVRLKPDLCCERSTSARIAQPSSICSSVIVKAGSSRTTWPWVALIEQPSLQALGDDAEASNAGRVRS